MTPANFCLGAGYFENILYLVDFKHAQHFLCSVRRRLRRVTEARKADPARQDLVRAIAERHAKLRFSDAEKMPRNLLNLSIKQGGALRDAGEAAFDRKKWLEDLHPGFSSLRVQKGHLPKKKDDLISLFHILMFCLKGSLPWFDSSLKLSEEIQGRLTRPCGVAGARKDLRERAQNQRGAQGKALGGREKAVDDADSAPTAGNHREEPKGREPGRPVLDAPSGRKPARVRPEREGGDARDQGEDVQRAAHARTAA